MKNLKLIFIYVQSKYPINKVFMTIYHVRCIEFILYTVLYFILLYIML
jgi:hypothetical protein